MSRFLFFSFFFHSNTHNILHARTGSMHACVFLLISMAQEVTSVLWAVVFFLSLTSQGLRVEEHGRAVVLSAAMSPSRPSAAAFPLWWESAEPFPFFWRLWRPAGHVRRPFRAG
jgi:hypothetical protein